MYLQWFFFQGKFQITYFWPFFSWTSNCTFSWLYMVLFGVSNAAFCTFDALTIKPFYCFPRRRWWEYFFFLNFRLEFEKDEVCVQKSIQHQYIYSQITVFDFDGRVGDKKKLSYETRILYLKKWLNSSKSIIQHWTKTE